MGIADHIKNGISRRGFVLGGAAAGAATVLAGCSKKTGTSDDAAGEPQVIKDDSKIISITDEYEAVDIDLERRRRGRCLWVRCCTTATAITPRQ